MAGAKEIRGKIASIKNTQKITKAMEMVAASKMRKAQDRMRAARPYSEKIRRIVGHLRQVNLDYKHPFTLERPVKAVGLIVVSTDRGLAGALNMGIAAAPRTHSIFLPRTDPLAPHTSISRNATRNDDCRLRPRQHQRQRPRHREPATGTSRFCGFLRLVDRSRVH